MYFILLNVCLLISVSKGTVKTFLVETEDKGGQNASSKGSDYWSKPEFIDFKHNGKNTVKRGLLLATLPFIGKQFSISFELFINQFGSYPWQNVLHLTKGENAHEYGNRVPLVAVTPDKQLHVTSAISGNWNGGGDIKGLQQGRWIKVAITQTYYRGTFLFEVFVDGSRKMMKENSKPKRFSNIKVYASDPWHVAVNGKIRRLSIVSKDN